MCPHRDGDGARKGPAGAFHNGGAHVDHGCIRSLLVGRRRRHILALWGHLLACDSTLATGVSKEAMVVRVIKQKVLTAQSGQYALSS